MKRVGMLILLFVVQIVAAQEPVNTPTREDQIKQLEAKIETLIVNDHNAIAALNEYAAAAKADPQEEYYRQQYAFLQRVIKMQSLLTTELNIEKWKSYAKAVRGYYYYKGYYTLALQIDLNAAGKFKTVDYATNALESLLLTGKNVDAARFAEQNIFTDKSVRYHTLNLVLEAANGHVAKAVESLQAIKIDPNTEYKSFFDCARIYSAANDNDKTLSNLKSFIENSPTTENNSAKTMILKSTSFPALQGSDELKTVLDTASKKICVPGSKCESCKTKARCLSKATQQ
ncbi:MAG: hypothetical protein A2Y12_06790 [Planctomycetes bacterium GWF2_42_9]|nr:MAG: hypothetical protein A2Y12_06790 [Planctomycetes bacterium GWF2_42_9]